MPRTIFLAAAAAATTMMVGLDVAESAQPARPPLPDPAAIIAQMKSDLAKEQPYTQNGRNSGEYLFTAYNKTDFDIWVTFYAKQWYGDQQTGQACIPPGKSAGIADSSWATLKARIQVEVKQSLKCGGDNNGQANLLTDGVVVVQAGTSRVTITNNENPTAAFVQ